MKSRKPARRDGGRSSERSPRPARSTDRNGPLRQGRDDDEPRPRRAADDREPLRRPTRDRDAGARPPRDGDRPYRRPTDDRSERPRPTRSDDRPRREQSDRTERPSRGRPTDRPSFGGDRRGSDDRSSAGRPPRRDGDRPNYRDRGASSDRPSYDRKPRRAEEGGDDARRSFRSGPGGRSGGEQRPFRSRTSPDREYARNRTGQGGRPPARKQEQIPGQVRLNRFIANSGICSRREADDLIIAGTVQVNGKVVTELGTKVGPDDVIHYGGQRISMEKKRYVLINKPKDTITTTDDPMDRRTVMSLVSAACPERLYPVGRLDRNTTGVLLLTNDGDLAKKLTHPSHGAEKIYHVTLDKNVTAKDLRQLVDGIALEDGPSAADEASYVGDSKSEVGLKLHMGRNRVVRRMFEAMGYEVVKLDRVLFAGLTKKDLQRGHWRHLSDKEVTLLKRTK
ncbi:MAG: pseudouridine synthase [Flavobacteriales bacterium]|nr:pseudouridine synthase [Flavobacteriales bacterium]